MADWKKAADHILKVEGGYINDPSDPGDATNFGISLRFLQGLDNVSILKLVDIDRDGDVDANDVKHLTKDIALQIYRTAFWDKYRYDRFYDASAVKLFDMSVNMGPIQAHKIFQRAMNAFTVKNNRVLIVDGDLGSNSYNKYSQIIIQFSENALLEAVRKEQLKFYNNLIAQKPELTKFLHGWTNRVYSV